MNFIKKNQIIVFTIGLMLITAGYLSYMNNNRDLKNSLLDSSSIADSEEMASIGDAKLVSANIAENTNEINNNNEIAEKTQNSNQIENNNNVVTYTSENSVNIIENSLENTIETNSDSTDDGDEYFTSSRLERETMYSQMLESYENVLNSSNALETQKQSATEEIKKINDTKNSIMICENLISTKGFANNIIFVNGDSVSAIIGVNELKQEEVAQIQNIISRELNAEIENIHISTK